MHKYGNMKCEPVLDVMKILRPGTRINKVVVCNPLFFSLLSYIQHTTKHTSFTCQTMLLCSIINLRFVCFGHSTACICLLWYRDCIVDNGSYPSRDWGKGEMPLSMQIIQKLFFVWLIITTIFLSIASLSKWILFFTRISNYSHWDTIEIERFWRGENCHVHI